MSSMIHVTAESRAGVRATDAHQRPDVVAASAVELGWFFALPPGWKVLEGGGLTLPRLKDAGRGVGRLLKSTVIAREDFDDASSEVRTGAEAAPGALAVVSVPLAAGRSGGASVM